MKVLLVRIVVLTKVSGNIIQSRPGPWPGTGNVCLHIIKCQYLNQFAWWMWKMCGMATNQLFDGIFFVVVVVVGVVMLHSISIICIPLIWPLVKLFAQVLLWQKHAVHKCPSSAGGLGFQFKLCQTFRFSSGISVQFWFSLGSCCRRTPRLDCILYLFTLHWLTHNELTRNHIRSVCMNAENSVRVRARDMKFCI